MNIDKDNIIKEFQESAILLTWKRINDIYKATNNKPEDYCVIYNSDGKSYMDSIDYYIWFYRKYMTKNNKKILLLHKKFVEKNKLYAKHLDKEAINQIRQTLNNLYPDFNFFEI
jgi:hypothetical protein